METIDEEVHAKAMDFVDRNAKARRTFLPLVQQHRAWTWTHLKKAPKARTGIGLYPDGMVEHDGFVGEVLKKFDDLGLADNTILVTAPTRHRDRDMARWRRHPVPRRKGNYLGRRPPRAPVLVRWPVNAELAGLLMSLFQEQD